MVETLPRKEALAIRNLDRQAFGSFCPRFWKTKRHARRQQTVLEPLFPGYLFVRFDPDREPWRAINGTFGVKRLVGSEERRPQPMPTGVMAQIFGRCQNGIVTQLLDRIEVGRSVRITAGPFTDMLARIEEIDERGRVSVLLELMGRSNRIRIAPDRLAPA